MTEALKAFLGDIPRTDDPWAFHYRTIFRLHWAFKRALRKARLRKDLTVHSLKKTLGTWAVDAGVPVEEVSMLLHHTDRAVTVDHYIREAALKKQKRKALTVAHEHIIAGLKKQKEPGS